MDPTRADAATAPAQTRHPALVTSSDSEPAPSILQRVMQYLGLTYASGGAPLRRRGPSRYGAARSVSVRLDEDIDALRARIEELERRLG